MKKEQQILARNLRQNGKSLKEISDVLHVSKGSVSVWVRDIELTDEQKLSLKQKQNASSNYLKASYANQIKQRQLREQYQYKGRQEIYEINNPLHIIGCMLYLGEGTKCRNSMQFTNMDVDILCIFMKFLRECYDISDHKIKIRIVCYGDAESKEDIENYWVTKLGLQTSNLNKTSINNRPKSSKNVRKHQPYGTCTISVNSTELIQRIYGSIQEYCKFNKPEWLD